MITHAITPPPATLITDGKARFGVFSAPVMDPRLEGFRPQQRPNGRVFGYLRTKEWVGFGITHPQVYCGVMLQNTHYVASSTFYALLREENRLVEHTMGVPPFLVKIAVNAVKGRCSAVLPGHKITYEHDLPGRRRHLIDIDIKGCRRKPAVKGHLELVEDNRRIPPLVVCLPVVGDSCMYTHKAPLPVEGFLTVGDQRFDFDPARDLANLDEQKARYPYFTRWQWGTFTAYDKLGRLVSVNLADQMYDHQDYYNENCLWVDDKLLFYGGVTFDRDQDDPLKPCRITDASGDIDLLFTPQAAKHERHNLLVAGVNYFQACGVYTGSIALDDGSRLTVDKFFGVAERMKVRF